MEWVEMIFDCVLVVLPALIIAYAAIKISDNYFALRKAEQVSLADNNVDSSNIKKIVLPLQLQSYERIVLFLERIAPENLIIRIHQHSMTAKQLHRQLIDAIQQEYEHNLSQQVYVSETGWEGARKAKEETIKVVNMGMNKMKDDATGLELSRAIFEILSQVGKSPSQPAIEFLKQELKRLI